MEQMKNRNLLIVDSSEVYRLELRQLLQGYMNILEAQDIETAIDLLSNPEIHIDLILQDVIFPRKSGFDLLTFLHEHEALKEIPVMIISTQDDDRFISRAFDLGAADYIRRPFGSTLLIRRVSAVVQMYRYRQDQLSAFNHSFLWLAAQSLLDFIGFSSLSEFTNQSYYVKANLTANTITDMSQMTRDNLYPDSYTTFTNNFIYQIMKGYDASQVIQDLDRAHLLESFQRRRFFFHKGYELHNEEGRTIPLAAYCQLYLIGNDVYAALLAINLSLLFEKSTGTLRSLAFDTVSGMFSRNYGERICTEFLQYHPGITAGILALEIRNFKVMNRHFGKRVGDTIISDLSSHLTEYFGNTCLISRSGSGSFLILMETETEEQVVEALQHIRQMKLHITEKDQHIPYRLAVGYAMYPDDGMDFSSLARMAEMSLDYSDTHPQQAFFRYNEDMVRTGYSRLGFNIMDIADEIPGAILVYRADGNEDILFANQETLRLFECESFEEFMEHVGGTFRGFVYKDDLDRVETTIWNQQNDANVHHLDYLRFRIVTRTGIIREVDDIGRLVDNPYYGRIFYVFLHDITLKTDVLNTSNSFDTVMEAKFASALSTEEVDTK